MRWVTGKPPNYAAPMVSTPAGGVPTGVFASVARGFDVWAFTALPLMFGHGRDAASRCVISLGVITYLRLRQRCLSRRPAIAAGASTSTVNHGSISWVSGPIASA